MRCLGCGHAPHKSGACKDRAYFTRRQCRCTYDDGKDPKADAVLAPPITKGQKGGPRH